MIINLKEKCQKAQLDVDEFVLFSKNGFTSEVLQLDDDNLTLLTQNNFATLLDNLSEKDLLVYKNKKYWGRGIIYGVMVNTIYIVPFYLSVYLLGEKC